MRITLHARRADNRVRHYLGRIAAAQTDRASTNAVIGWLLAELYKTDEHRRPYWLQRWIDVAREMNEEARS